MVAALVGAGNKLGKKETKMYTVTLLDHALQKEFTWKNVPESLLPALHASHCLTIINTTETKGGN